jgi:4-hydroxy-tetrahydrodipicolinate reductase
MIRIGLIGFGKAGKAAAHVILNNPKFELAWVMRKSNRAQGNLVTDQLGLNQAAATKIVSAEDVTPAQLFQQEPVDVIIDFSHETGIYQYGKAAAEKGIKIISAISHYSSETAAYLHELAKKTTVFWSPNITLGINYLMYAAKFLKKIAPWVDVEIIEEHFKQKTGVSGTALKLAEALDLHPQQINSIRAGGIVGKHEVIFGFPYQTVRLVHESITREAFGNGALFAAEQIQHKPAGFYTFDDIMKPFFRAD